VVPTLLELLGREPPPGLQGRSLLAQIDGAPAPLVVAYSQLDRRRGSWESAVVGPRKLIRTRARSGGERLWLYDLVADPGERRNLVADEPVWRGYLLSQLAALERLPLAAGEAAPATIDPELRARLHALGYL
jgi:arylsulfatase A-like enzyme